MNKAQLPYLKLISVASTHRSLVELDFSGISTKRRIKLTTLFAKHEKMFENEENISVFIAYLSSMLCLVLSCKFRISEDKKDTHNLYFL